LKTSEYQFLLKSITEMSNKEILWRPETGQCSFCDDEDCKVVRGYTYDGMHKKICFGCWNMAQVGCIIDSNDWDTNVLYIFQCETPPSYGNPSRQSCC
jgi:hypothetical protein